MMELYLGFLQIELVTGKSPASIDTGVVYTAHGGRVEVDLKGLVLPSVLGLLEGIPFQPV